MYAGMQAVNPSVHAGANFDREYQAAMTARKREVVQAANLELEYGELCGVLDVSSVQT